MTRCTCANDTYRPNNEDLIEETTQGDQIIKCPHCGGTFKKDPDYDDGLDLEDDDCDPENDDYYDYGMDWEDDDEDDEWDDWDDQDPEEWTEEDFDDDLD